MKFNRLCTVLIVLTVFTMSCSSSKTYFSPQIRAKIERAGVNTKGLQFYVDKNIELKREITKEQAHLTKGKVSIEDGKYINIITLKKNTPGICNGTYPDKVLISFENGENKFLTFGRTKNAASSDPYKILAFEWYNNGDGLIKYEGDNYHLTNGSEASVMIKSKFVRKADQVKERTMEGVKVTGK